MREIADNIFLFLALAILSLFLGIYLRKRIDRYNSVRLARDLAKYFHRELPSYKKDKEKINWQRVLKMLKEEPTTDQVVRWKVQVKKLVDKEIRR